MDTEQDWQLHPSTATTRPVTGRVINPSAPVFVGAMIATPDQTATSPTGRPEPP